MLDLNAEEWRSFDGGYRQPYDATPVLRILAGSNKPSEEAWSEIWNNLYHQNDVGVASYATLPWLLRIYREKGWIDFELPTYAYAIEAARREEDNPEVPDWLADEYHAAVDSVLIHCLSMRTRSSDPNFRKAVVLLAAIIIEASSIAELIDTVEIGDEEMAIEAYYDSGSK